MRWSRWARRECRRWRCGGRKISLSVSAATVATEAEFVMVNDGRKEGVEEEGVSILEAKGFQWPEKRGG